MNVLCQQHALFKTAGRGDVWIGGAAHCLIENRDRDLAGFREKTLQPKGEILLQLEAYGGCLRVKRRHPLPGQVGCVVQDRICRIGGRRGIALADLLDRRTCSEAEQDDRAHIPGTGDAGLAVTDMWINGYVLIPVRVRRDG